MQNIINVKKSLRNQLMHPFSVPPPHSSEIVQLRKRLESTIFPHTLETKDPWELGMDKSTLQSVIQDWINFDFQAWHQRVNKYPQFKTFIHGIDLHFIHVKSSRTDAQPLLLIHGWPGSVLEFWDIIPSLTEPDQGPAFHLVIPSLPGYGFSSPATTRGCGIFEFAKIFHTLMMDLEYSRYIVQGGDWGSFVARAMGIRYPQCQGIHVNLGLSFPSHPWHFFQALSGLVLPGWMLGLDSFEQEQLLRLSKFLLLGTGYQLIQGTCPHTLAFALQDSPAGLLAWMYEKFHVWTGPVKPTRQRILDHITLYWMTRCIGSSLLIYKEHLGTLELWKLMFDYCPAPTAYAVYPHDIFVMPRGWFKNRFNLIQYNRMQGGHFAAMEDPQGLVQDIQSFATLLPATRKTPSSSLKWICLGLAVYLAYRWFQ